MSARAVYVWLLLFLLRSSAASALDSSNITGQVIDSFVASLYPAYEPGAAVIVAKEGETLLRKGYGVSAIGSAAPIQPNTVFRLGSISKQFTAMGILLLVQDGVLSLSDPVTKFFPEFPRFLSSISVEHLLTHTSGFRNYTSLERFRYQAAEYSPESIIQTIRDLPLSFNPGEAWEYSDSNYFLLGVILERVSGLPYCTFMADHIFRRFGMSQTRCAAPNASDQVPAGYFKRDHDFSWASYRDPKFYFSAGSILSTVDDLLRWNTILKRGEILRIDLYLRTFQAFKLPSGESTFYGYGWAIHDIDGIEVIEHGGMVDGFENHILWMPDEDVFIAVLSNSRGRMPTPDVLATRIALYLSSHRLPLMDTLPNPTELSPIMGAYRTSDSTYDITLHDGNVVFSREGGFSARLVQLHDGRLLLEDTFTFISFQTDHKGMARTLTVSTKYGKDRIALFDPRN